MCGIDPKQQKRPNGAFFKIKMKGTSFGIDKIISSMNCSHPHTTRRL
jgi:hypothetical protein